MAYERLIATPRSGETETIITDSGEPLQIIRVTDLDLLGRIARVMWRRRSGDQTRSCPNCGYHISVWNAKGYKVWTDESPDERRDGIFACEMCGTLVTKRVELSHRVLAGFVVETGNAEYVAEQLQSWRERPVYAGRTNIIAELAPMYDQPFNIGYNAGFIGYANYLAGRGLARMAVDAVPAPVPPAEIQIIDDPFDDLDDPYTLDEGPDPL